ncbi:flavodoxin family protein [Bacillus marinisedimentorum]|uniref:flavodoxin family protein n=1 Tax=Bacillus marinisedimentorum TaxID=1821260 RepID=UPI000871F71E|nr:NAD(P)H-dependent oxidoreductase [Bacillus marinisedimentorum]
MFVIYGSSREKSNSEQLAKIMIDGLETEEVHLRDKNIQPITDMRHDPQGFSNVGDDYYEILHRMLSHEKIVFVTPLYWYGMSGLMKNFIDRFSETLRDSTVNFREQMKKKKMYVVIVGGDNPKLKALPLVMQFTHIFDFFGASFEGYLIGKARTPGEILEDKEAVAMAKRFNSGLL